jgi:hypothetical protein
VNILFYDLLQDSDAPEQLTSSSLADFFDNPAEQKIVLPEPSTVNCIGIGNMDSSAVQIALTDTDNNMYTETVPYQENGLYLLGKTYESIEEIDVTFSCSHIGRLAFGKAVNIKTAIPKEPALVSTNKPRVTLSGQVIDGLGGYNYWQVSLDTRYKIDREKLSEITRGFPGLSRGLPMFVSFEDEKDRLPFKRLYVNDKNQQQISFESSINKNLFSRRFIFEERF